MSGWADGCREGWEIGWAGTKVLCLDVMRAVHLVVSKDDEWAAYLVGLWAAE